MSLFKKSAGSFLFGALSEMTPLGDVSKKIITSMPSTTVPTSKIGTENVFQTLEKLETVFMDVDTEGEKRGYERAAAEYDAAYERIEQEYLVAKQTFEYGMAEKDLESSRLISKLQELEQYKKNLEVCLTEKTKQVSTKYGIPVFSVTQSLASGQLLVSDSSIGILELIYRYKNKKLKEAEAKGYADAKRLYNKKINELKENLWRLKEKGDKELQDMSNLIVEIIREIAEIETKVAELEIALKS